MEPKVLLFVIALVGLLEGGVCWRGFGGNGLSERDFAGMRSDDGSSALEFDDSSTGPEKLSIEILQVDKNGMEEKEEEADYDTRGRMSSEVDEETIRKAEKMADKDLLNGLNRILKNNETLKDVFKAENVYQIS